MGTFKDWVSKTRNISENWETQCDESLVLNQLGQMVDRVAGLVHDFPEEKRTELINNFVTELKTKI